MCHYKVIASQEGPARFQKVRTLEDMLFGRFHIRNVSLVNLPQAEAELRSPTLPLRTARAHIAVAGGAFREGDFEKIFVHLAQSEKILLGYQRKYPEDRKAPKMLVDTYHARGRYYYELGCNAEATLAFSAAITWRKRGGILVDRSWDYYWRAAAHLEQGNIREGLEDLTSVNLEELNDHQGVAMWGKVYRMLEFRAGIDSVDELDHQVFEASEALLTCGGFTPLGIALIRILRANILYKQEAFTRIYPELKSVRQIVSQLPDKYFVLWAIMMVRALSRISIETKISIPTDALPGLNIIIQGIRRIPPELAVIAYSVRGTIFQSLGKMERAIEDYRQASEDVEVASSMSEFSILTTLANLLNDQDQQKEAIAVWDRAIPFEGVPWSNRSREICARGIAHAELGNLEAARQDFVWVIGHPETPRENLLVARVNRGGYFLHRQSFAEALIDLTWAVENSADQPRVRAKVLHNQAMAKLGLEDWDGAAVDLRSVVENLPDDYPQADRTVTMVTLAVVLHYLGDAEKARICWEGAPKGGHAPDVILAHMKRVAPHLDQPVEAFLEFLRSRKEADDESTLSAPTIDLEKLRSRIARVQDDLDGMDLMIGGTPPKSSLQESLVAARGRLARLMKTITKGKVDDEFLSEITRLEIYVEGLVRRFSVETPTERPAITRPNGIRVNTSPTLMGNGVPEAVESSGQGRERRITMRNGTLVHLNKVGETIVVTVTDRGGQSQSVTLPVWRRGKKDRRMIDPAVMSSKRIDGVVLSLLRELTPRGFLADE